MLFLCTGNSARSQMAEAILRRHAGDRFNVHSAGLIPQPIHPLALQVMEEAGYDLSRHTSKGVKEYLGMKNFAFVISVCPRTAQDCPLYKRKSLRWAHLNQVQTDGQPRTR